MCGGATVNTVYCPYCGATTEILAGESFITGSVYYKKCQSCQKVFKIGIIPEVIPESCPLSEADKSKTVFSKDRKALEELVWFALFEADDAPCISISRGRELLGFTYMEEMHAWCRSYKKTTKELNK